MAKQKGEFEHLEDEDQSEDLALASTVTYDQQVALPEVNNNDAVLATIAFPALAVMLGAMCWNQRRAFKKQTLDDYHAM